MIKAGVMGSHELDASQQALLDDLLERFHFTPIVVRLTATMLDKSIIDARDVIQAYLARTGIVEYAAIGQGPDSKIQVELPFVSASISDRRKVSFYRPVSKSGDPRFWIERLASVTQPDDALILAFFGTDVVFVHLSGDVEELARNLAPLLPSTFEERGRLEALVHRLNHEIQPLAGRWLPTGRSGPTGVGFTLETLLGVRANSSKSPDFEGLELKAYRRGAITGPGKLVSLFAKTPDWLEVNKGLGLLTRYGYQDAKRARLALYCTITATPNSLGWSLVVDPDLGRVSVAHGGIKVLAYSFKTLEHRLQGKHAATLFVRATSRGAGASEEFRYDEVILCREPSLANLLELLGEGLLGLDFTLHQKTDGSARDHGYLWRIRESAIPRLYAYRRVIASGSHP
jgi:hypothetical protein